MFNNICLYLKKQAKSAQKYILCSDIIIHIITLNIMNYKNVTKLKYLHWSPLKLFSERDHKLYSKNKTNCRRRCSREKVVETLA